MKYVIAYLGCNQTYVAMDNDGSVWVHRMGTMCYKEPKMKWFNTLEEARIFANKVADNPLWERTYGNTFSIYEAKIDRYYTHDENGNQLKPYTVVSAGKEVEKIKTKPINW